MYIQKMEGNSKIPAVVVSKDVVMHSIKSNNLSVFDGKKYYNLFDERREFPLGADDIYLNTMLLYVVMIEMSIMVIKVLEYENQIDTYQNIWLR